MRHSKVISTLIGKLLIIITTYIGYIVTVFMTLVTMVMETAGNHNLPSTLNSNT